MVAVKKTNFVFSGGSQGLNSAMQNTMPSAEALVTFQKDVSETFRKAGATITGFEGSMVLICFGSPLERVAVAEKENPLPDEAALRSFAQKAVDLVSKISLRPEAASWDFGMDAGNCSFAWTAISGYSALGIPVQRAKILSHLAGRYKTRIAISASIKKILPGLPVRKLDDLKRKDGSIDEAFYRPDD